MPIPFPDLAKLSRCDVVCRSLRLNGDWLARVAALRRGAGFFWLDGAAAGPSAGDRARSESRFSFAGIDPWATLRVRGRQVELEVHRAFHPDLDPGSRRGEGDPLGVLRSLLPRLRGAMPRIPFRGGAVGVLGYELAAQLPALARLGPAARPARRLPDLVFLLVDRVLAHDAESGETWALGLGAHAASARSAARELVQASEHRDPVSESLLRRPFTGPVEPAPPRAGPREDEHARRVGRILEHVAAGDCYQACLTHTIELDAPRDPFALHAALRARSPAPYAAYLELPDGVVISSSPERFLRADGAGRLESRPIKGTCPRYEDPSRDAAARAALASSAKDRAENLMIVDLVRNDLGRVCELGSVHVPELFAVESFATVSHLVSTVRGRLRPGLDALDAVAASFPAGSMTGAPKLAAMRILRALEPERRGFYAGALGYLDAGGGLDLSVVIRTAFVHEGRAQVGTGGGIVADSVARLEWQETLAKARAIQEAVAAACAGETREDRSDAAPVSVP